MMNKRNYIIMLCMAVGIQLSAQEWPAVESVMKPASRWWWLGSAVDEKNLEYNLEEYAKAGLGGLEITPIYGVVGNEANELSFLSPEWMQALRQTQALGKKTGIDIDMNTGTGWPFGGPEVTLEEAATKAIFQTYTVEGGQMVKLDIEVQNPKEKKTSTLSRVMAYQNGKCLNLTAQCKEATLQWKAPAGTWEVVVLYNGKTRQQVKRAAPGGEGYVMDHLSEMAVKRYLHRFTKAFKSTGTPIPHNFFNDSYEVYGADWSPLLLEEFERRRGYKLEEHFLEFLSPERTDNVARVVADYRETMSDMLIENFTHQWTRWAHQLGGLTRNQAHGSPANLIDTYAAVDVPECEGFGLSQFQIKGLRKDSLTRKNFSDISMLKYASSAAHISGKPLASAETFTWLTEHFRTSLSQCKPDMDLMFAAGINHMFFHGTPYSPKEDEWPGWNFYASINMSPVNSIWHDAPAFFQYITRCQSFLQMGKPDNDFLIYLPIYDMWYEQEGRLLLFDIHKMGRVAPRFISTVLEIIKSGYDVDYISDSFILNTAFRNGSLVTPGGAAYKALIIPGVRQMPANVLTHLEKLAAQGATLVFLDHYPQDVPGLGKLDSRRKQLESLKAKLPAIADFANSKATTYRKGTIITGTDYAQTLALSNIPVEEMSKQYGLHYNRRVNDKGHHYFVSCLQQADVEGWATLGVSAASVMIFDPLTGEKGLAQTRQLEGKTQVYLQLHSGESCILQAFDQPITGIEPWHYLVPQALSIGLDHGWNLTFTESVPKVEGSFDMDTPRDWTELDAPNATTTMATGRYSLTFTLPTMTADEWLLDLGDVRESAQVTLNGKRVGTAWCAPFQLRVGKYLKPGKNHLEVEVTNLAANRIAEMDRQQIPWRKFKEINVVDLNYKHTTYGHWQPMPSGLNGKVTLIPMNYQSF